ncbi:MAG: WbqC family protein [Balneolales bacterium]|nr:WbqC family protein [Balneolales bacterium]
MSVALIQPQFAPNLFDLASMLRADRVILLDTDIWSRKGRTHRAALQTRSGLQWVNIPIHTEDKKKPINQVQINHSEKLWFETFWNAIHHNYHHARYFDYFEDELLAELQAASNKEKLIEFTKHLLPKLLQYLEIEIEFEWMSELVDIDINSELIFQEYQSKNYIRQLPSTHPAEIKDSGIRTMGECSILHVLLTHGPESFKIIDLLG